MQRRLRLLTLVLGVAAAAVLAPAGSATKGSGSDSMTCSLSAGTTFTYVAGTSVIDYEFDRADQTATAVGTFAIRGSKAGSVEMATPSDAATLKATFGSKRGPDARPVPVSCTA